MSDTARLSPPERFNGLVEGLFSDIRTRIGDGWVPLAPFEVVLIKLIWRRLRRMSRRFAAILARLRDGTLVEEAGGPGAARAAGPARVWRPSRRLGWVIYAVSYFVWLRHYELEEMLEDPEMAALVAEAPELGRVLRPMCRMLAVKPPTWLRLKRAPRPVVERFPPAPEWLLAEPGAELRADGTVWMRLGASTKWRPGCGVTLEEARKFDYPVRIWPRAE